MADASSIYALMSQAIAAVPSVGKNSEAPANMGGYKFRGIEDIVAAIKPVIAKLGLFVVPTTLERIESERRLAGGKVQYVIDLRLQFTWYGPAGDSLVAEVWGQGSDMGDKATQKAMTAAYKSMLQQTFCIGDANEDAERHEVAETEGTYRRSSTPAPSEAPDTAPKTRADGTKVELPAGWPSWSACDSAHTAVLAQIKTMLEGYPDAEERGKVRVPLDSHKAAYGWPMVPDALSALSMMVAKATRPASEAPPETAKEGSPPSEPLPVANEAQDQPDVAQSGHPETVPVPQDEEPLTGPKLARLAAQPSKGICPWCEQSLMNGKPGIAWTHPEQGRQAWHKECKAEWDVEGDQKVEDIVAEAGAR